MIYDLIDDMSQQGGFGVRFVDADAFHEFAKSYVGEPLAMFARPRSGTSDRYRPPGASSGRRQPFDCAEAWELHVFAKSSQPGAQIRHHEEAARELVDPIIIGIRDRCAARRIDMSPEMTGGFVAMPGESTEQMLQDGAEYVVRFYILRAVARAPHETTRAEVGPVTNTFPQPEPAP